MVNKKDITIAKLERILELYSENIARFEQERYDYLTKRDSIKRSRKNHRYALQHVFRG